MQIQIRQANEHDYPAWLGMRKQLWPEGSFDELKDLMHLKEAKNFVCYFAEVDGHLAGFIEVALRLMQMVVRFPPLLLSKEFGWMRLFKRKVLVGS